MRNLRTQAGLTLVELMVAMVIGLLLLAGISQVFVSNKQTYRLLEAQSHVQENGRFAFEFMARDVRMADSAAICLYLADRYGAGRLAPAVDAPDRGRFLFWMFFTPGAIEVMALLQHNDLHAVLTVPLEPGSYSLVAHRGARFETVTDSFEVAAGETIETVRDVDRIARGHDGEGRDEDEQEGVDVDRTHEGHGQLIDAVGVLDLPRRGTGHDRLPQQLLGGADAVAGAGVEPVVGRAQEAHQGEGRDGGCQRDARASGKGRGWIRGWGWWYRGRGCG